MKSNVINFTPKFKILTATQFLAKKTNNLMCLTKLFWKRIFSLITFKHSSISAYVILFRPLAAYQRLSHSFWDLRWPQREVVSAGLLLLPFLVLIHLVWLPVFYSLDYYNKLVWRDSLFVLLPNELYKTCRFHVQGPDFMKPLTLYLFDSYLF